MDAKSLSGITYAAPMSWDGMTALPDDLVLQIALRIPDAASMRSFTRTCTRLAGLRRVPAFADAIVDRIVSERCASLRALRNVLDRCAPIYQLACRMAKEMQPSHLKQLMACLEWQDAHGWYSGDSGSTSERKTGIASMSALLRAGIAAAICSGRVEGFNEAVKQYAMELMDCVPWDRECASSRLLPLPTSTDADVALFIDAVSGIWRRMSTVTAPSADARTKRLVATYILDCIAPLPMKAKLAVLKDVMHFGLMQSDSLSRFLVCSRLNRSAAYPETLDVPLAQELFAILGVIVDERIGSNSTISNDHLMFARMLPRLPWRENSMCALDWLMKALPRKLDGLSASTIEEAIPAGIFSGKEIAYLAQSLSNGSFSWKALAELEPAGVSGS